MKTINFTKFPVYGRSKKKESEKNMNLPAGEGFNFFDFIYNRGDRRSARKVLDLEDNQDIELTEENIKFFLPFFKDITPAYLAVSFELLLRENKLWKDEYEKLLND